MFKNDERKNEFKFDVVFNELTQQKQKLKKQPDPQLVMWLNGVGRFFLFVVAAVLIVYVTLDGYFSKKKEAHAIEVEANPEKYTGYFAINEYQVWLDINAYGYSALIIILGSMYTSVAERITEMQNF